MSYPIGGAPDGSWQIGSVGDAQGLNESGVKSIIRGKSLPPWSGAQTSLHETYAKGEFVHREVVRLDNRIDEIVVQEQRAQLATFSTNGTWTKPAGAYKIVVDVLSGSSGGGRSNNGGSGGSNRGGLGGYSGGWTRMEFDAGIVPNSVSVSVGGGGGGGTGDGAAGAAGIGSSFGSLASSDGAASGAYGDGNFSFRIRGGNGASGPSVPAQKGGSGSFDPGGLGGPQASAGENGASVGAAKAGMGSGGGGGGNGGLGENGGRGGDGGWPSGPGAGGGSYSAFGFAGNGGNGAGGAVFVTSYYRDTAGNPPTAPTSVTASAVTSSSATISWTASTDDVRVEKYVVILGSVEIGETSGTTYHLSQLTSATAYQVQVVAVDLGNNKSTPGSTTFTTS